MKAVCILYQVTNNIIRNKKDGKAVKMIDRKVTKELVNDFPELKVGIDKGEIKWGQTLKMPDVPNPDNIEMVQQFDMEADFVFPNIEGALSAEEVENVWKKKHDEACSEIDDKQDYQRQMRNHLRWFLEHKWSVTGFTGTHLTLELQIKENA